MTGMTGSRGAIAGVIMTLAGPGVIDLKAQNYDMGFTGPQCEIMVANALNNPSRTDTLSANMK